MERILNAANLNKISWANETMTLHYKNGMVVNYNNVPEGIAVGMADSASPGSFMGNYVVGKYSYTVLKRPDITEENIQLMHYKDTSVGLWATDRPELIPEELKHLFFQLEYKEV